MSAGNPPIATGWSQHGGATIGVGGIQGEVAIAGLYKAIGACNHSSDHRGFP